MGICVHFCHNIINHLTRYNLHLEMVVVHRQEEILNFNKAMMFQQQEEVFPFKVVMRMKHDHLKVH